jgi:hypothetical protein
MGCDGTPEPPREGIRTPSRILPRAPGLSTGKEEHQIMNEGTLDRVVRVVLGIALISLVFAGPRSSWGLVGLVPLATGLLGFCPLYRILGVCPCRVPARNAGARS